MFCLCICIHIKVSPESGASCLRLVACTALRLPKTVLSYLHPSCLVLAPQNCDHHTLISRFTGVNSPFSTASAGTALSPSSPLPHPSSPIGMCSAQRCLLDGAFRGVSVSPWQLLAPCASPSGGWPTARRPLLHTPCSIPLRTLASLSPLRLALVATSSLDRISDTILM